ncbi:2-succinyl-5-enolpyruvyl-6-hydroxy-3-cyclohexene-1-carboxylic-acid synthase [Sporolactobacillus laevolacticus]|uniref:2-succinyl-5-enolpyruvyl-6-hydroxy-3-cyclohexene-1-carboxylate synthase n=1 Tax=Sporolactobacillus laevolacticus DSM 442 TaxID=1395513 RepID=V6J5R4_9BACL|nr:2-succinyl-5-enolpyruvyl-6-hydroxy-3-cyclohexene-1-carboxylic-acid synthase [Sporolactobacillus laevolacticus]EST12094.1 2-succinyl-5-enolpyruvyl-6-hydroxy-3-cyclohexene-1-carboxylate synthase [Sporolactobacillus laevolacticus DSM 442]
MNHQELMTHYLSSFIHTLYQQNVREVVISPGSRSTPLAILFEEHPEIQTYLDIDERSAGFMALGLAKASGQPVAMLCTSGTAAANYYPAVIEAYCSRVPLIVITSDRPYELQHVGAPQTIDQGNLYGNHVKKFFQMELSEHDLGYVPYNRALTTRAVAESLGLPHGPVQINVPLREPLLPGRQNLFSDEIEMKTKIPIKQGTLSLSDTQLQSIADQIGQAKKGVLICGEMESLAIELSVTALAKKTGFPILADPLSQLRRGKHSLSAIIESYDTFLRVETIASQLKPDLIIRLGATPVSKALKLWMEKQVCANLVIDGGMSWRDPAGVASEMIYCDEKRFCDDLISRISIQNDDNWINAWRALNQVTKSVLSSIDEEESLSEEKLFIRLTEWLPEDARLFVGNSMPIRELDTFLFAKNRPAKMFANRGANGIDGVVSTAVGVALSKKDTILVIGDLSFFHGMNGLLAAQQNHADLTIILVNNDGGGIFSFLPQASEKMHFESLFGTPHGLDFAHTARLYGADYTKIECWDDFNLTLEKSFRKRGIKIIEVPTKRADNVKKHHHLLNLLQERFTEESIYES